MSSKSWLKPGKLLTEDSYITDPNAFLFVIKPELKYIGLKEERKDGKEAICSCKSYGPIFGSAWDLYTRGTQSGLSVYSSSNINVYDCANIDLIVPENGEKWWECSSNVEDIEVFSVDVTSYKT